MNKLAKQVLQYLIFFTLGVIMLYYALKDIDLSKVYEVLQTTDRVYLTLIVITGLASFYFRAARWKMMLDTLGSKPVSVINVTMSVCIGYFVNLVTPRLGEIARCGVVSRYENIKLEKVAGTMVVERIVDLITLIILLIVALIFNAKEFLLMFGTDIEKYDFMYFLRLGVGVVLAVAVVYFVARFIMSRIRKSNETLYQKINAIFLNLKEGLLSVRHVKNKTMFFLQSVFLWGAYLMMVYYGFKALPGTEHLGLRAALLVLIFGSVGMIITPGGIGAYQLIVQNTLEKIYGIAKITASSFGLLSWALQTLMMIVAGILSWIFLPIINQNKVEDDKPQG